MSFMLLSGDVLSSVAPAAPQDRTENLTNDQTTLVAVSSFLSVVASVTSVRDVLATVSQGKVNVHLYSALS